MENSKTPNLDRVVRHLLQCKDPSSVLAFLDLLELAAATRGKEETDHV